MAVMHKLGVPYTAEEIQNSVMNAQTQAKTIADGLVNDGVPAAIVDKEIVALIAYIQRIGVDYSKAEAQ
jgi:cytochrome c oxidase cbb3-type subunit I/II